ALTPTRPSFQPWMTLAWPSGETGYGCPPRSHEASNCCLVDQETPTYCTETVSPAFAAGPVPVTMSLVLSAVGFSAHSGIVIAGFAFTSVLTDSSQPPEAASSPPQ